MEKRVGVITGATSGIGAAVAKTLSEAGWRLVLSGRTTEKLTASASLLGDSVAVVAGDLEDASVPDALLSAALEKFGRCDMCLNNAGVIEVGPIQSIDIDRVCEMVRTNVEGAFRIAYVFLKHFAEKNAGHLINVSSVLGKKVRPTAGAYAATKFAMEALRMELSKSDVRVSCIQPGLVMTGLHDRWETHPSELMGIEEPLLPADIARMVSFIVDQPANVRIPQLMILPKGHEI